MAQDIPHDCLNMLENQPFQYLDANKMPIALLFAFAMQRTDKEVLIEIAVVGRAVQHFEAAVRTVVPESCKTSRHYCPMSVQVPSAFTVTTY